MQLDPPAPGGDPRHPLRGLLVWGGLTLLAAVALALALAMLITSLALELGAEPAPPPTPPIQISPPAGHQMAQ